MPLTRLRGKPLRRGKPPPNGPWPTWGKLRPSHDKSANVVGHQHPAGLMRGLHLLLVIDSTEPKLICSFGINPVLLERLCQRVGLAILVQMDSDTAHEELCG